MTASDSPTTGESDGTDSGDGLTLLGQAGGMMGPNADVTVRPRTAGGTQGVTVRVVAGDGSPAGFSLTLFGADAEAFVDDVTEAFIEAAED